MGGMNNMGFNNFNRGGMMGGMRGGMANRGRGGMNGGMNGGMMGGMGPMGGMAGMGMNPGMMGGMGGNMNMGMGGMQGEYTFSQEGSQPRPRQHLLNHNTHYHHNLQRGAGLQRPPKKHIGTCGYLQRPRQHSSSHSSPDSHSLTAAQDQSLHWQSGFGFVSGTGFLADDSVVNTSLISIGGFGGGSQPHFNPAFFGNQQSGGGGDGNWNPHGAKRPRPE